VAVNIGTQQVNQSGLIVIIFSLLLHYDMFTKDSCIYLA